MLISREDEKIIMSIIVAIIITAIITGIATTGSRPDVCNDVIFTEITEVTTSWNDSPRTRLTSSDGVYVVSTAVSFNYETKICKYKDKNELYIEAINGKRYLVR